MEVVNTEQANEIFKIVNEQIPYGRKARLALGEKLANERGLTLYHAYPREGNREFNPFIRRNGYN